MKNVLTRFVSLSFAATSMLCAQGVQPHLVQNAQASGSSASVTLALPAVPVTGNTLLAVLGYAIYGERSVVGPDDSWTCTKGAGSYVRTSVCTHIVVKGDSTTYTFPATSSDGPGIQGLLLEVANTSSAQIAYSYTPAGSGVTASSSPALVPVVLNTLPLSTTVGGQAASPTTANWSTIQATSGLTSILSGVLTPDTTTPVQTTFSYPSNNAGNTVQTLILLAPGVIAAAPAVSPAAGSYASAQTISLADTTPGAVVHYTLDGTAPSCTSATYQSGILLTSSITVKSVACAPGYANSAVVTSPYTIAAGTLQGISSGPLGDLHGYVPFAGDAFHTVIAGSPVDSNSANIIAGIGAGHLHHDWSSVNGGNYGIPYTVVDSTQTPLVPFVNQLYSDESDLSLYPIPTGLPIESLPPNCTITGDNHAIMFDKATGVDYEFYQAQYCPGQTPIWQASNGVMWDTTIIEKRPYSYTSVDAAGLSVFEGLVRYDEIVAGAINHALRFTTAFTRCDHYDYGDGQGAFVAPATHAACNNSGSLNIMGMRIRLKSSFNISSYSPTNQIILKAMQQYGMILADNGSSLFYQGTPDARWDDNDLSALDQVLATNFEVVQMPTIMTNDSHPTGAAPVIKSFTASSSTISVGQSVTLNASLTGASYSYVDKAGFMRNGTVSVTPTETTTYQLTSRNEFGETTASTTVNVVSASQLNPNLTFVPIMAKTYGMAAFTVSTTSQSSGAVTYKVVSGPATISGNLVTLTGVGTVALSATQAATGQYTAGSASISFTAGSQLPTLAFGSIANVSYGASAFPVQATSNSPAAISYSILSGPATIVSSSGNATVTPTGAGTVTLQATQAASGNYSATTASASFVVSPVAPTLTLNPIAKQVQGATVVLSSSSNSSGSSSYSLVSGPAVLSGNLLTGTGPGQVTVMVQQVAAGNYTAASATTSFTVTAPNVPAVTILSINPIPAKTFGSVPFQVSATSNSNGAIYFGVMSGPAFILNSTVFLTGPGTVRLLAVQAGTPAFTSALATSSFTVTLAVKKAN